MEQLGQIQWKYSDPIRRIRHATSYGVAQFSGVAVVADEKRCSKF